MEKLSKLAELFAEYKLYPVSCFTNKSFASVFINDFSNDQYSKCLHEIFKLQQYSPEHAGADLPWWGKNFFSTIPCKRVMVVSQDSNSPDAGSVVFHSCLWPYMKDKSDYKKYIIKKGLISYSGYDLSKDLVQVLNLDNVYITDALKVYKKGSWIDKDYDSSKELLDKEINICNPDLIVLLGKKTMKLLEFEENFSEINGCKILTKKNRPYIVSTFPSRANRRYKSRVEITKSFFRKTLE